MNEAYVFHCSQSKQQKCLLNMLVSATTAEFNIMKKNIFPETNILLYNIKTSGALVVCLFGWLRLFGCVFVTCHYVHFLFLFVFVFLYNSQAFQQQQTPNSSNSPLFKIIFLFLFSNLQNKRSHQRCVCVVVGCFVVFCMKI